MAVYLALLDPGDKVLGLRLDQGGHLTHGSPVNASGKLYDFVSYGVTPSDERIDLDQVRGARPRAPAEDHRHRGHGLPADHRPAPVPPDRRRGRRAVHVRRRPHRRPRRRGHAPEPDGARRRHHDLHHPQDPPGSAGRGHPVHRRAGRGDRQVGLPRAAGRPARPRGGGQGGRVRRGGDARPSRTTPPRSWPTPPRWPRRWPATGSASCRAAPTTTSCSSTCARSTPTCRARRPASPSTRPASASTRTPCPTTRARRTSPPACASARRRSPRRAWAPAEMATIAELIHRVLVGREDEAELAAVRDDVVALCSKFTPYPEAGGRAIVADYLWPFAPVVVAAALVTGPRTPLFHRLSFRDRGGAEARRTPGPHAARPPCSAAPRSSSGSWPASAVAWQRSDFAPVFDASTIPLGVALGAVVMFGVGQLDDLRDVSPAGEDRRHGAVGQHPVDRRREHPLLPHPLRRAAVAVAGHVDAAHRAVGHRHDHRHQLHRRPRRPGRRDRGDRRRRPAPLLRAPRRHRRRRPGQRRPDRGRRGARGLPRASCPTTSTRRGSSWATPARCCSGCSWRRRRSPWAGNTDAQFSGQTFFFFAPLFIPLVILGVPVFDTAFSILRRARRGARASRWPTRTTCTTASCASATASAAAWRSCGPGPRCCRRSCCTRPTAARATSTSRSRSLAAGLVPLHDVRRRAPRHADVEATRSAPTAARIRRSEGPSRRPLESGSGSRRRELSVCEVANLPRRAGGGARICRTRTRSSRLRMVSQAAGNGAGAGDTAGGSPELFDLRAKQQLNRGYSDGLARGIEIVLTPLIFGGIGWLLDTLARHRSGPRRRLRRSSASSGSSPSSSSATTARWSPPRPASPGPAATHNRSAPPREVPPSDAPP